MAGDSAVEGGLTLEHTPTWIIAATCSAFVLISFILERGLLHRLGKWFRHHRRNDLNKALDNVKDELMQVGFISLLLTVFESPLTRLRIPERFTRDMLPCRIAEDALKVSSSGPAISPSAPQMEGESQLLTTATIHELHIFIFILAIVHVLLTALTMVLARIKIYTWKIWETEIISNSNKDLPLQGSEYRFVKHDQFIKDHADRAWSSNAMLTWIVSFIRQFTRSVTKRDYQALRNGFIVTHMGSNKNYNFHTYILRSFEDDFKKVVGISGFLWIFVMISLLLNIDGFHTNFWMGVFPFIILLAIGTKLQHVITMLALKFTRNHILVKGDIIVQPKDDLFWIHRPKVILVVIHFVLFNNAFQASFLIWVWVMYGHNSCLMEDPNFLLAQVILGLLMQILVSYVTFPLYALVTQMGTSYKKSIFTEPVRTTLVDWFTRAKERVRSREIEIHGQNLYA